MVKILFQAGARVSNYSGSKLVIQNQIENRNFELLQILFECDIPLNSWYNDELLCQCLVINDLDMVKILFQAGARVSNYGGSKVVIQNQIKNGNFELLQILFECDIPLNSWYVNNILPQCFNNSHLEIAKLLLQRGATIDKYGYYSNNINFLVFCLENGYAIDNYLISSSRPYHRELFATLSNRRNELLEIKEVVENQSIFAYEDLHIPETILENISYQNSLDNLNRRELSNTIFDKLVHLLLKLLPVVEIIIVLYFLFIAYLFYEIPLILICIFGIVFLVSMNLLQHFIVLIIFSFISIMILEFFHYKPLSFIICTIIGLLFSLF
jgi:hypothetical protein